MIKLEILACMEEAKTLSFLEIRNFGPINDLKIDADKHINIIIGPQASGKSTMGKIFGGTSWDVQQQ